MTYILLHFSSTVGRTVVVFMTTNKHSRSADEYRHHILWTDGESKWWSDMSDLMYVLVRPSAHSIIKSWKYHGYMNTFQKQKYAR